MRDFPYPSYLRTERERWALTQGELAALFGIRSDTTISKYEKLVRTPNVDAVIASEFIFGEHARRIFPALYAGVELKVTLRAALLAEALQGVDDKDAAVKRELLQGIAERAANDRPHV